MHSEVEIRREREFLQRLLRECPVGIAVLHGPEYCYAMANPEYERFARGKGDIIGRSAADVWPEAIERLKPMLDRVRDSQECVRAVDMLWQLLRDKGPEEVFLTFSIVPLRDEDGEPEDIMVLVLESTEQMRAKRGLEDTVSQAKSSLSQLEAVLQSIDQGIVIADLRGNAVKWNRKALEIHRISPGEDARKALAEFAEGHELFETTGRKLPPEEWPLARAARGEAFSNLEVNVRRADTGETLVFCYGGTPVSNGSGEQVLAVVTVEDITGRKQAENRLRDSEARLRFATEAASMGTWLWDIERGELDWDDRCKALFGLAIDAPMSYDLFLARVHPEDRARVNEAVRNALFGGRDYNLEFRIQRPNGSTGIVLTRGRAWHNGHGKPTRMVGIAMDATARKGVEDALRLSEERFRVAVKASATMVMTHDRDLTYTSVYRPVEGFASEDMIGKRDDELLPPADVVDLVAFKRSVLQTGVGARREIRLTINGKPFVYDLVAEPLKDTSGQVVGLVAATTDITERKRMEDELRSLADTLERRVAERTGKLRALVAQAAEAEQGERQRLAAALHDNLQQLLVAARMWTGTIKAEPGGEAAKRACEQLDDLLRDAVEASRSLAADLSPPALYEGTIAEVLDWLAGWARAKQGLEVAVSVQEGIPNPGERVRVFLFHAVRELLMNVVMHARTRKAAISAERLNGDMLRVVVRDEGAGFDATTVVPSGLGLFAVRERIELLGGAMEIESAPGKGTVITLAVPVRPIPLAERAAITQGISPAAKVAARALSRRRGGKVRVLLADDHQIFRQGLVKLLQEQSDIDVVGEAADGLQVVELVRETLPDVVVMDVNLPHVSGLEATRRIKSDFPDIGIIGLSMYQDQALADKMREAGASEYVTKGGAADELVKAVRAVSSKRFGPRGSA